MKCNGRCVPIVLGILGLCLVVGGIIVGWVIVPKIIRSKIADLLPLKRDSESWDRWENLPVPIEYRIFAFEITNPDDVMNGKKPEVREVGPYVYNEKRVKTILSVDEENEGTVVYNQKIIFEFNKTLSGDLSEDDVLTFINPTAMLFGLVIDSLKIINPVIQLYDTAIKKLWHQYENPLFIKTTIKELVFEGLPIYCNQPVKMENLDTKILCEAFRILHPRTVTLDAKGKNIHLFSFFKYKSIEGDGTYKIDLGVKDVTKIGQILSWNNKSELSFWKGKSCNKLQGTDTTVFRPYLEEDNITSLYIYHSDICRSIELVYDSDTEYKGVKGRRYIPSRTFLSSPVNDSNNYCYCPQSLRGITHYGGCLQDGSLELTGCQGAPVVISHPHFLNANPNYQVIKGLNPDVEKHQIFLDLEPYTGYPLRGRSSIQVNAFLKSIPEVELMKNLPNVLTPIIWVEEKVELTDELIDLIYSQLLNNLKIADILKWSAIVVGVVLSVGSFGFIMWKKVVKKVVKNT